MGLTRVTLVALVVAAVALAGVLQLLLRESGAEGGPRPPSTARPSTTPCVCPAMPCPARAPCATPVLPSPCPTALPAVPDGAAAVVAAAAAADAEAAASLRLPAETVRAELEACVAAHAAAGDMIITGDAWGFDGHRTVGRVVHCIASRPEVRNAADLYAYTGSATVTMADALRKSKPQSPGFVYSFEENDDFTLAAMKMIKAHAPVFENILHVHGLSTVSLPHICSSAKIDFVVWEPAPPDQYNGMYAWTRAADFATIREVCKPTYWLINNIHSPLFHQEWSVRLRAPDSGYEWVADVEDRQAFHMGKYQVSGTFRRQRDA